MVGYDVAIGFTKSIIDNVLSELYDALQPSGIWKATINVGVVNIDSVDFGIQQAPTVTFENGALPDHVATHYTNALKSHKDLKGLSDKKKQTIMSGVMEALPQITLTINLPVVDLQVNFAQSQPPLDTSGSLSVVASVTVDAGQTPTAIKIQAISGTIGTPDTTINLFLNESIIPYLVTYLNENLLDPIAIPVITFEGITVSLPEPVVGDGFFVAYSALGTSPPDIPAAFDGWPADGVFVAVDAALLGQAGNIAISKIGPKSGDFSWSLFTGNYGLLLGNVYNIDISADQTGKLTATIDASASIDITVHTPNYLPNFSFSAAASGNVNASAHAAVLDSKVYVTVDGLNSVDLNINFPSLPDWISDIIGGLLGGLTDFLINDILKPFINQALTGLTIDVYTIDPFFIPLGPGFEIRVVSVETVGINPAGNTLLAAYGIPSIASPSNIDATSTGKAII